MPQDVPEVGAVGTGRGWDELGVATQLSRSCQAGMQAQDCQIFELFKGSVKSGFRM